MALSGEQEVHLPDGPAGTYVVRAELPSGEWLCARSRSRRVRWAGPCSRSAPLTLGVDGLGLLLQGRLTHRAEVGARRGRVVRPEGAFALGGPEGRTLDPAGAEAGRVDEPQRGRPRGARTARAARRPAPAGRLPHGARPRPPLPGGDPGPLAFEVCRPPPDQRVRDAPNRRRPGQHPANPGRLAQRHRQRAGPRGRIAGRLPDPLGPDHRACGRRALSLGDRRPAGRGGRRFDRRDRGLLPTFDGAGGGTPDWVASLAERFPWLPEGPAARRVPGPPEGRAAGAGPGRATW